jgi:hypothetical protein
MLWARDRLADSILQLLVEVHPRYGGRTGTVDHQLALSLGHPYSARRSATRTVRSARPAATALVAKLAHRSRSLASSEGHRSGSESLLETIYLADCFRYGVNGLSV